MKKQKIIAIAVIISIFMNHSGQAAEPHVPIGMNSNEHAYYSTCWLYTDITSKLVGWNAYDTERLGRTINYTFDADGYPRSPQDYAGFWTWIAIHIPAEGYNNETWVLRWEGDADLRPGNNRAIFPGIIVGDHRVEFTMATFPDLLSIDVRRNNPADPFRKMTVVQKKYEHVDLNANPFHEDFVRRLAHFDTFRFMDLGGANHRGLSHSGTAIGVTLNTVTLDAGASSIDDFYKDWFLSIEGSPGREYPRRRIVDYDGATKTITIAPPWDSGAVPPNPGFTVSRPAVQTWSERSRTTALKRAGNAGIPIEDMITLCNVADVHAWICIPAMVDDDYVRRMAQMFKDRLNPHLKIYIEYSNETWNWYFEQFTQVYAMALFLGIGGERAYHAYRLTQISAIFNDVFGYPHLTADRDPGTDRLVRVIGAQAAGGSSTRAVADFNSWRPGDPQNQPAYKYLDASSIAPYFAGISEQGAKTQSITALLDNIEAGIPSIVSRARSHLDVTQPRNLQLLGYEGGFGGEWSHMNNIDWGRLQPYLRPILYHRRMQSIMYKSLEAWSDLGKNAEGYGVGLFVVFNFMGIFSKYGAWAHADGQIVDPDPNPRWHGLLDYIAARQTPVVPNLYGDAINGYEVALYWDDNSHNEAGFEIDRRPGEGGNFQLIGSLAAGTTTHLDTGLALAQTYVYRMRAVNSAGPSPYSNELSVTMPTADATIPKAPVELVAVGYSGNTIRLTWKDRSLNESKFVVERKGPGETVFKPIAEMPPDATSYIDDNLPPNTTYVYRVRAYRGAWPSAPSNEASAGTWWPSQIPTGDPTQFSASVVLPSDVRLSWKDNNTTELGYTLHRQAPGTSNFTLLTTLAASTTVYTDTSLAPGIYYYRLSMTKADSTVAEGDTIQAYVPSLEFRLPVAPERLTGSVPVIGRIELSWIDMDITEDGFIVERKAANSLSWEEIGRTLASETTYQDFPNTSASETYRYRVRAFNSWGLSGYSNEVEVNPSRTDGGSGSFGDGGGAGILPGTTKVGIVCTTENAPCSLELTIYSRTGPVRVLEAEATSTETVVDWDLRNDEGVLVPSGVYMAYPTCNGVRGEATPEKMVVIR